MASITLKHHVDMTPFEAKVYNELASEARKAVVDALVDINSAKNAFISES